MDAINSNLVARALEMARAQAEVMDIIATAGDPLLPGQAHHMAKAAQHLRDAARRLELALLGAETPGQMKPPTAETLKPEGFEACKLGSSGRPAEGPAGEGGAEE